MNGQSPGFPAEVGDFYGRLAGRLTSSWWGSSVSPFLKPLGAAYGWGAAWRRRLYAALARPLRVEKPVVSLGNLTVGGSGKTPLALTLLRLLRAQGRRPVVLSRGYGRSKNPAAPRPLIVSRGQGPLVGPLESGDEPWLLAAAGPVAVDADRRLAARTAIDELGADLLILDDGFQYLPLAADCRILLAPARRPFGNGATLPAGPLREPLAAHRLADILVSAGGPEPAPEFKALAQGRPFFAADYFPRGWRPLASETLSPPETLAGRRALAFCGLGRPDSFRRSLEDLGLNLTRFLALADHQAYGRRLLADLGLAFVNSGAEFMISTDKDAVKLPPDWPWPLFILETELRLAEPEAFLKAVLRAAGLA